MLSPSPRFSSALLAAMVMAAACAQVRAEAPAIAAQSTIETGVSLKSSETHAAESFDQTTVPAPQTHEEEKNRSVIPEPAAAALGLIGLGLIVLRRYRV